MLLIKRGGEMFQLTNEYFMRTKLKELAAKSGLTGREIAKQLDVTPETVSRHMNGRTAMSFDDAARYSELIGCSPEALIFEPKGIDVIGEIQPDYSVQTFNIIDGQKTASAPFSFPPNTTGIMGGNNKTQKYWTDHSLYIFDKTAMREKKVDSHSNERLSIYATKEQIGIGLVYPDQIKIGEQPTYSVSNTRTGMPLKNLNIVWATPILTIYTELSLLGIEIID
jgi:transcriptional regulator with XRE-family HTH domain